MICFARQNIKQLSNLFKGVLFEQRVNCVSSTPTNLKVFKEEQLELREKRSKDFVKRQSI